MATTAAAAARMKRLLASPRTVAHALNWQMNMNRPILSVHLGQSFIDLSLIHHPGSHCRQSSNDNDIHQCDNSYNEVKVDEAHNPSIHLLPSIPFSETKEPRRNIRHHHHHPKRLVPKPAFLCQLARVVHDYKVCGLVVSWSNPNEEEEKEEQYGRLLLGTTDVDGSNNNKVWDTLDQIVRDKNIVNIHRPVCLWNKKYNHNSYPFFPTIQTTKWAGWAPRSIQQGWGSFPHRTASTAAALAKKKHNLFSSTKSQDQDSRSDEIYTPEGRQAAAVAADYLRTHWPDLTTKPVREADNGTRAHSCGGCGGCGGGGEIKEDEEDARLWSRLPSSTTPESARECSPNGRYDGRGEIVEELEELCWSSVSPLEEEQYRQGIVPKETSSSSSYVYTDELDEEEVAQWITEVEEELAAAAALPKSIHSSDILRNTTTTTNNNNNNLVAGDEIDDMDSWLWTEAHPAEEEKETNDSTTPVVTATGAAEQEEQDELVPLTPGEIYESEEEFWTQQPSPLIEESHKVPIEDSDLARRTPQLEEDLDEHLWISPLASSSTTTTTTNEEDEEFWRNPPVRSDGKSGAFQADVKEWLYNETKE